MNTVKCSNHICGKEYHESFEKCPFCGTVNENYKKPVVSDEPKPKGMNSALRVLISAGAAAVALVLGAILITFIGLDRSSFGKALIAGIAIAVGSFVNKTLKAR